MATQPKPQEHWLAKYASNYHAWKPSTTPSGQKCFQRPLGLVETSFDIDGNYYGGRADMTAIFTLALRHTLSKAELRRRIALAWTSLRLQHVLLMSRVADNVETAAAAGKKKSFVVDVPASKEDAVRDVESSIIWVEDLYGGEEAGVMDDEKELYRHALNVGRIIEPEKCMSKMHVLPLKKRPDGKTYELRFLIIMAHQISDGLSAYNWFSHFIRILNSPLSDIEAAISTSIAQEQIRKILPPAQEDLYPPIAGNKARQRWFWAIIRVLRHVKKPLPPTFVNPLCREEQQRLEKPVVAFEPKSSKLFDYSEAVRPPMNSGHVTASLSPTASQRLIHLCRSANVSIGAGCFALAGLSMMEIHESRYPDMPPASRPAFAASFPLNPRAFFANPPAADSCMLAFSEGIIMPFLPRSLPIEGRFRLVAKHANRELRVYQKRLKGNKGEALIPGLDKHSPGRLLATGYLAQIERANSKLPMEKQVDTSPQGALAPSISPYGATCGVSSVGSTAAFFKRGTYDLSNMEGEDLVVDFLDLKMGVRARDNEFLVGSSTNAQGIVGFGVSYDASAISEEAATMWKGKIEGLLEKSGAARL
ncbi:hypothetical protein N0V83_004074 [Neocucurbitaria cava]|uniref:Alcohol acetyltransferase n=1 Tax=Neocucurbitaria cava TaxID=798079 RepID=A0A9W8YAV9_9PLEO|nr:hypothetical protein N0V83_004074 [Neocucurbitaria cava]